MSTAPRPAPPGVDDLDTWPTATPHVMYPVSDGKPMAESTRQFQWIVTIQGNLDVLYGPRADVFVGGDNFVYPVEGQPGVNVAPDVYVAFGRPKGHRPSYKVWEEGGTFPQVVFEVLSPNNTYTEMQDKRKFYQKYGAEEYYVYDPEANRFEAWVRQGRRLVEIVDPNGRVSPRLGIRFDTSGAELVIYRPDGKRFLTFVELGMLAKQEKKKADQEKKRADKLAARLRELGVDPDSV
ncbi:MAG TPA: Uma2 family endonuclease [Fimbriiglobus sp.]|nr:Uma2 family endonuclease [Fimbriiglobus sp.]